MVQFKQKSHNVPQLQTDRNAFSSRLKCSKVMLLYRSHIQTLYIIAQHCHENHWGCLFLLPFSHYNKFPWPFLSFFFSLASPSFPFCFSLFPFHIILSGNLFPITKGMMSTVGFHQWYLGKTQLLSFLRHLGPEKNTFDGNLKRKLI